MHITETHSRERENVHILGVDYIPSSVGLKIELFASLS